MIKLFRYIKSKLSIVRTFRQNKQYFKKGKYTFDETMTFLYLKNDINSDYVYKMLSSDFKVVSYKGKFSKTIINKFIKIIIWPFLRVKTSENSQGIALLISRKEDNVKIFDLDSMKVIIGFSNKSDYEDKITQYKLFNTHFNIPQIYKMSDMVIVEQLLKHKPINEISTSELVYMRKETFKLL